MLTTLTVKTSINAPIQKVWACFTQPNHVMQWNHASDDWHSPAATNDLQVGGKFVYTMAAKDGSFSFDFSGTYTEVLNEELLIYKIDDGREVKVTFASIGDITEVVEIFEPENENPLEMQQAGWQAILDSFKGYVKEN
ncbi:MAG: SRPBCC family protein [Ferruginibacter sp.]|nr:SRPBCC family protein [Ferruginibacter sp.]